MASRQIRTVTLSCEETTVSQSFPALHVRVSAAVQQPYSSRCPERAVLYISKMA